MAEPFSEAAVLDSATLDELNNPEAKALLDTIDGLRALSIGEIVHLPQIIVVGDQSSGKSSVLEAISHVRFPVKGDLCTRFATELVLRKANASSVDVSIRFSDEGSADGSSNPSRPFQKKGFHRDDLPQLIEEAKEWMGIKIGGTKGFSKDVLRVEVTGPEVPSLTLVDLPGLFHAETANQSAEGKKTVRQLIRSYIKQENSIILAVVSANAQLANQAVLTACLKYDPSRKRTLGVITKPDLAPPGSTDEKKYLQLARNEEGLHKFLLGWHVLRNRAEQEIDAGSDDRDRREAEFLASGAWATLPPRNKGVQSLRRKLGKVLLDQIRETLPGVISDIEGNLDERVAKLNHLGKARATPGDMRAYLIGISEEYQRLVRDAVNGIYSHNFFGKLEDKDRKLRAKLRNLNNAFDIVLSTKGSSRKILRDEDTSEDENEGGSSSDDGFVPEYLQSFVDCYDFPDPEEVFELHLSKELEDLASGNLGREFPSAPNNDLVIQLFQKHALPWKDISEFHVNLVTDVVKDFVEQLISHVVGPDETTATALLRNCVDPFFEMKRVALMSKTEELLRPYVSGYGLPLTGEFRSRMDRRALSRLASLLTELPDEKGKDRRQIAEIITRYEELRGSEFGTDTTIDMMEAYYEMSRRTFAENVINLGVEACLVRSIEDILKPSNVHLMENDKLVELASESHDAKIEREMLQSQVHKLKEGLSICRRYKPRGSARLSSLNGKEAGSRSPALGKADRHTDPRGPVSGTPLPATADQTTRTSTTGTQNPTPNSTATNRTSAESTATSSHAARPVASSNAAMSSTATPPSASTPFNLNGPFSTFATPASPPIFPNLKENSTGGLFGSKAPTSYSWGATNSSSSAFPNKVPVSSIFGTTPTKTSGAA